MKSILSLAVAAIAIATLSACVSYERKPVENVVLSREVYQELQKYLAKVNPGNKAGAFAVSEDGKEYWRAYCGESACLDNGWKHYALEGCERDGARCFFLADRGEILVPYQVAPE